MGPPPDLQPPQAAPIYGPPGPPAVLPTTSYLQPADLPSGHPLHIPKPPGPAPLQPCYEEPEQDGTSNIQKGSVIGQDEAKARLKAYAAMKSGSAAAAKKRNKELKKFFDEDKEEK